MISVYALINPINDTVFYIGASMYPNVRLYQHCLESGNSFKLKVISDIQDAGLRPELLILEVVEYSEVSFYEDFYVSLFKSWGYIIPQCKSNYKGKMLSTYQQKMLPVFSEKIKI